MAAALLLAPDAPSGSVSLKPDGRPRIDYVQREDHRTRIREAITAAARIYLAAGAREVLVPMVPVLRISSEADLAKVEELRFDPAMAALVSAHQQGTARMAGSARDGAVDPDGMLWGTRDVYVFDSSIFPSSASSHTMTPIMTVSRYLSTVLTEKLSQ